MEEERIVCLIGGELRRRMGWSIRLRKLSLISTEDFALLILTSLVDALAYKFGYETVEEYARDSQKTFSLLEVGLLDKPSAPLLLVNVSMFVASKNGTRSITGTGHE